MHSSQSCARCDLFQIDLSYQNRGARDFAGARIRQSDLSLATADRARFSGANMSLANLFGTRLLGADLTNANLDHATLVGAYFGGARLGGATLAGANLSGAELDNATGLTQTQLNAACGDSSTSTRWPDDPELLNLTRPIQCGGDVGQHHALKALRHMVVVIAVIRLNAIRDARF